MTNRGLPMLKVHHCMADGDGSVIIQPDGGLSKCEHYTVQDEFGSIYSDECDKAKLDEWKKHTELEMCAECPFYPACVIPVRCTDANNCSKEKMAIDLADAKKNMKYQAEKKDKTGDSDIADTDETDEDVEIKINC